MTFTENEKFQHNFLRSCYRRKRLGRTIYYLALNWQQRLTTSNLQVHLVEHQIENILRQRTADRHRSPLDGAIHNDDQHVASKANFDRWLGIQDLQKVHLNPDIAVLECKNLEHLVVHASHLLFHRPKITSKLKLIKSNCIQLNKSFYLTRKIGCPSKVNRLTNGIFHPRPCHSTSGY